MVGERQLCVCGGRDEFVCVSVCVEMGVCVVGERSPTDTRTSQDRKTLLNTDPSGRVF